MLNKMISNSDILSDLFSKREYDFLEGIDQKIDTIELQRNELSQKELDIIDLIEELDVEEKRKNKVFKHIDGLYEDLKDFEVRIKELNQAIIRVIIDKETEHRYKSQDLNQMVCFAKSKIKEYMTLEETFYEQLKSLETRALIMLDGKDDNVSEINKVNNNFDYIDCMQNKFEENDIKENAGKDIENIKISEEFDFDTFSVNCVNNISNFQENDMQEDEEEYIFPDSFDSSEPDYLSLNFGVMEETTKNNACYQNLAQKENEVKENTIEVPRRVRQGSALNEIKALKEIEKREKKEKKNKNEKEEFIYKLEEKVVPKKVEENCKVESNVLLISEKEGKIFLPYKKEDLDNYLKAYPNEYETYNDVIEKEYILPLDEIMKNQTVSRFREMYDLIRNKELKSMIEAMKISTKFMFRYDLNPAIIAACNSKKELDRYLYCLENNKLDKFDAFDIKFELNLL